MLAGLLLCLAPVAARAQQTLHCSPCYHSFGNVQIGQSQTYTLQITNTGSIVLKLLSQPKPSGPFALGKMPWTVNPRASFLVTLTYSPKAQGHNLGAINILSTAENSPLTITAQGYGIDPNDPQLTVSPPTLDFGFVQLGSSSTLSAKLYASNAPVTISSGQSTSSEYAIVGLNLPVTIAAGHSLPVSIQFTPNASGVAAGKAGFVSNALNTPAVAELTGTGLAPGAHEVDLTWKAGDERAVGYNVYRATAQTGPFTRITNDGLAPSTEYSDSTVAAGNTYYYATTEVDVDGKESAYSKVVSTVIPTP